MENNNMGGLSEEMEFEPRLKAGKKHSRYGNSMCKGPEVRKSSSPWKHGTRSPVSWNVVMGVNGVEVSGCQILLALWAVGGNLDFIQRILNMLCYDLN